MWTVPVIAMQPLRQIGTSFMRMPIATPIGPFAQGSLDEALSFSVGARRVEPGKDMPQAPPSTHRIKWQRAKHLGVVGHDAANPYAQVAVVARGMVEERRCTGLALIGEHLSKTHSRMIINRHKRCFPARASDMIARIAGDTVAGTLNARQLLAIDVQQLAGSGTLVAARQRRRIERRQTAQSRSRQHPRYGGARDPQLSRNVGHRPAALAQRKHPLRGALWNRARRAMRPRAAIAKARFTLGSIPQHPFPNALALGSTALRHRANRFTDYYGLNHPQSTCWRHWSILVGVHSVLLIRTDGVATISFFQLDRGDNVLRLHT